jgi:transcriptional regulator with GAF, ATPase, and Fis domain
VADVAETESVVLIEGESGTGKELLARAIHNNSRRKSEPFVAINCAAIPETLLESELFGYEKGAFTGAVARKPGKFELADNGTVFLDEIGELSPVLQVKLLRFLQSGEFEPLGATSVKHADVRIISATKRDLGKMVEAGEFRDDLFYRINVIAIRLPRLADRTGDIAHLANHFLKIYAEQNCKDIASIGEKAMSLLNSYNFPGNIRELENIVERAVVLCKGNVLSSNDLPEQVKLSGVSASGEPQNIRELNDLKKRLWREVVTPVERDFALRLLGVSGGNISAAARLGGLHRKQLQRILKRNGVALSEIPSKKES